jgi:hypothetical protein
MSSPSDPPTTDAASPRLRKSRCWILVLAGTAVLLITASITAVVITRRGQQPPPVPLGLRPAGQIPLPGDSSRFDYASLDPAQGLLFIAHLGASEIIEVDVRAHRVIRTIADLPGVHGVLVVPDRHRVYATATDSNQMVILDEDTGASLGRGRRPAPTPTGWPTTRTTPPYGPPTRPAEQNQFWTPQRRRHGAP